MEALRAHGKLDNGQEQKYGLDDEGSSERVGGRVLQQHAGVKMQVSGRSVTWRHDDMMTWWQW